MNRHYFFMQVSYLHQFLLRKAKPVLMPLLVFAACIQGYSQVNNKILQPAIPPLLQKKLTEYSNFQLSVFSQNSFLGGEGEFLRNRFYTSNTYGIDFFVNFQPRLTLYDSRLDVLVPLRLQDSNNVSNYLSLGHGGSNGYIDFYGAGNLDFRRAGKTVMTLTSGGLLNVDGSIKANTIFAEDSSNDNNHIDLGHDGTNSYVNFDGAGDLKFRHAGKTLMTLTPGGSLELGTEEDPRHSFTIKGGVLARSMQASDLIVGAGSEGEYFGLYAPYQDLHFTGINGTLMTLSKEGLFGIGTLTPTERLEVNGNIKADLVFAKKFIIDNIEVKSSGGNFSLRSTSGGADTPTGYNNATVGADVALRLASGSGNTAFGREAAFGLVDGNNNTAIGFKSGYSIGNGVDNVFVGSDAGFGSSNRNGNVAIGSGAGYNESANFDHSVFIGYRAGATFEGTDIDKNIAAQTVKKKSIFIVNNQAHVEHPLLFGYFGENERPDDPFSHFVSGTMGQLGINTHELIDSCALTVKGAVHIGPFDRDPNFFDYDEMVKDYLLWVERGVVSEDFIIRDTDSWSKWPDYVFEEGFQRRDLASLKKYIDEHKHLPGVTSREEVEKTKGYDLRTLDMQLLEKIEEITLYTIEQQQQLDQQARKLDEQTARLDEQAAMLKALQQEIQQLKVQQNNK